MNIALLLSGGVDSAVATHLLVERGLRPDLYYIKIGMDDDEDLTCTAEEDLELCQAIARRYGLPLEVIDLQKEYWDRVVSYTMDHVKQGLTPNPDVMCNRLIKFGAFEEKVGHGYDRICTGHYARVVRDDELFADPRSGESIDLSSSASWLGTAPDPIKDQTDFLAQLDRHQVEKIMLPLGHLRKEQVRQIALDNKLAPARRKDSQGICFLGKINYNDFVRRFLGERVGDVIELETGKKVGEHRGYWFHTIGQRKGLGLSGGPWFVVKKNIRRNIILVSQGYDPADQYGEHIGMETCDFISHDPWQYAAEVRGLDAPLSREESVEITFKVRHTPDFTRGRLSYDPASGYLIESEEPIQGIAPGQYAVLYDTEHRICFGSGMITRGF